jgi:low affinity Fe/Cu permease
MKAYNITERFFERLSNIAINLFSNSLVFLCAVILTGVWFYLHDWNNVVQSDLIRDIILAITFLSFFIIQKSFRHFSQVLHLKLNELVVAHENAHNSIVKAEDKSTEEIEKMEKEHILKEERANTQKQ